MPAGLIQQAINEPDTQVQLGRFMNYLRAKDEEKRRQEEVQSLKSFFDQSREQDRQTNGDQTLTNPTTGAEIPSIGQPAMQSTMQRRTVENLTPAEEIEAYGRAPRLTGLLNSMFERASKEKPDVFGGEYGGYYRYDKKTDTAKRLAPGMPRLSNNRVDKIAKFIELYGKEEGLKKFYESESNLRKAGMKVPGADRAPNLIDLVRKANQPGKAGQEGKIELRTWMIAQGKKGEILRTEPDGTVVYGLPGNDALGIKEVELYRQKPTTTKKDNTNIKDYLNNKIGGGAKNDAVLREKAKQHLEELGYETDDASIDTFLEKNPDATAWQ